MKSKKALWPSGNFLDGICIYFFTLQSKTRRRYIKYFCLLCNQEKIGQFSVHVLKWPQEQIYLLLFNFFFPKGGNTPKKYVKAESLAK